MEMSQQQQGESGEDGEQLGESMALVLIYLAALILNGPVLLLYSRSKHIRSTTDKFLLNLLLADAASILFLFPSILVGILQSPGTNPHPHPSQDLTPFQLSDPQKSSWVWYEAYTGPAVPKGQDWGCAVSNGILGGVATASELAALQIAMERYLAVVKPLHYHKFLTTPSILATSLLCLIISLGSGIMSTLEPGKGSVFPQCGASAAAAAPAGPTPNASEGVVESIHTAFQTIFNATSKTTSLHLLLRPETPSSGDLMWAMYSLSVLILLFLLPLLLMLYIYTRIWLEARRQKIKIANQYKPYFLAMPTQPKDANDANPSAQSKIKAAPGIPPIVKFRLMHRLRATRLDRAGKVAVVAIIVTSLCWSPYYCARGARALQIIWSLYGGSPGWKEDVGGWRMPLCLPLFFAVLHPLLSPLFYSYRYKRLRGEIRKGLGAAMDTYCYCYSCPTPSSSQEEDRLSRTGAVEDRRWAGDNKFKSFNGDAGVSGMGVPIIVRPILVPGPVQEGQQQQQQQQQCEEENCFEEGGCGCGSQPPPPPSTAEIVPPCHILISVHPEDETAEAAPEALPSTSIEAVEDETKMERALGKNIFNYLHVWVNSYSRRWLQHRESVTSTASFITLISNKYHNSKSKSSSSINTVANV